MPDLPYVIDTAILNELARKPDAVLTGNIHVSDDGLVRIVEIWARGRRILRVPLAQLLRTIASCNEQRGKRS